MIDEYRRMAEELAAGLFTEDVSPRDATHNETQKRDSIISTSRTSALLLR